MEEKAKCGECQEMLEETELSECEFCGVLFCKNCSHKIKGGTYCVWHKYVDYNRKDFEEEESDNARK